MGKISTFFLTFFMKIYFSYARNTHNNEEMFFFKSDVLLILVDFNVIFEAEKVLKFSEHCPW